MLGNYARQDVHFTNWHGLAQRKLLWPHWFVPSISLCVSLHWVRSTKFTSSHLFLLLRRLYFLVSLFHFSNNYIWKLEYGKAWERKSKPLSWSLCNKVSICKRMEDGIGAVVNTKLSHCFTSKKSTIASEICLWHPSDGSLLWLNCSYSI